MKTYLITFWDGYGYEHFRCNANSKQQAINNLKKAAGKQYAEQIHDIEIIRE